MDVDNKITGGGANKKIDKLIDDLVVSYKKAIGNTGVRFGDWWYPVQNEIPITVTDVDANIDDNLVDTVSVKLISATDPNGLQLTLIETGTGTGIFQGSFDLSTNPAPNKLKVSEGDTVLAEYSNGNFNGSFQVGYHL